VLGNVINVLAEISSGKKKDLLALHRDSALIRILQNTLGGNSWAVKFMLFISGSINYDSA